MRSTFAAALFILTLGASQISIASTVGNAIGVGYLSKTDNVKAYASSTGLEVDESVPKNFPFIAFNARAIFSGIMAAESISDGRLHVRYWKNGKDSSGGEGTAWLDPSDVVRVRFDCCGDQRCSGVKPRIFASTTYSDCFVQAIEEALNKTAATTGSDEKSLELEKLRLQLEIEKLKLEQARMRAGDK